MYSSFVFVQCDIQYCLFSCLDC